MDDGGLYALDVDLVEGVDGNEGYSRVHTRQQLAWKYKSVTLHGLYDRVAMVTHPTTSSDRVPRVASRVRVASRAPRPHSRRHHFHHHHHLHRRLLLLRRRRRCYLRLATASTMERPLSTLAAALERRRARVPAPLSVRACAGCPARPKASAAAPYDGGYMRPGCRSRRGTRSGGRRVRALRRGSSTERSRA